MNNNYQSQGNGNAPQQTESRQSNIYGIKKTVSGIPASDELVHYTITTNMIRDFLQRKLDAVITRSNNMAEERGYQGPKIPPIKITAYSYRVSNRCLPIMIVLPASAEIRKTARKKPNSGDRYSITESPQFDEGMSDNPSSIRLHDPIFKFLRLYSFGDSKYIQSTAFKHANNLTSNDADMLRKDAMIHRMKNNHGNSILVMALDPFPIIHNMIEWEGDNRPFEANIDEVKNADKKSSGHFVYHVGRELTTHRKNGKGNKDERASVMNMIKNTM